jgi:hypothetical protein
LARDGIQGRNFANHMLLRGSRSCRLPLGRLAIRQGIRWAARSDKYGRKSDDEQVFCHFLSGNLSFKSKAD